jgi:hypothetical protein
MHGLSGIAIVYGDTGRRAVDAGFHQPTGNLNDTMTLYAASGIFQELNAFRVHDANADVLKKLQRRVMNIVDLTFSEKSVVWNALRSKACIHYATSYEKFQAPNHK